MSKVNRLLAMQIQYNITRLEEWCKTHYAGEAITQLEHLTQATKLLQLKKATLKDIQIIYDVCWFLAPTQVQKLIQNYSVADYEVRSKFRFNFSRLKFSTGTH